MHPNPIYRQTERESALGMARTRGFGLLMMNGDATPLIAHIPFALAEDGTSAELHLVRSNPVARATTETRPALIAVNGPDAYVSPDWYGVADQVPTWNYMAVHLHGQLEPLPDSDMRASLDALSAQFETRLLPKAPWRTDKMPPDLMDRLMRSIRPFRFHVERVESTAKLAQNKSPDARHGAADGMEAAPIGQEAAALAALMRGV